MQFGLDINHICVLCSNDTKTFNHLFFQCPLPFQILVDILRLCGWRGFNRNWSCITGFISNCSCPNFHHSLLHFGFAAVVCRIWHERNALIFSKNFTPARTIIHDIIHMLKCGLHTNARF